MTEGSTGETAEAEVSIATVLTLLKASPSAPRQELLRAARDSRHKLAATLLTLWRESGEELTAAETSELLLHQERIEYYRQLWSALLKLAPGAYVLKGMSIASLYPPRILRSAGDIDVICPAHATLWDCSRHLTSDGWELAAFTLGPSRPGDGVPFHLGAEFRKPAPGPSPDPYAVGLCTAEIMTDIRAPAWQLTRAAHSPSAADAVALVAERWERPFRSRDLMDLALLLRDLDDADIARLPEELARIGLWPQWREAMRALRNHGMEPARVLPSARAATGHARLHRTARSMMRWISPVRALALVAQSGTEGGGGRLAEVASDLVHSRIGTRRLLRAGLPLFGIPLDAEPARRLHLDDVGRHLVARTPLGSFLLVAGRARQEWLDEARVRAGSGI
ncbi:hypothetical protein LEL86_18075 [Streptomyces sp. WA6-1-16]|uniref:hypothetical protein n=1 Tax=Streptomyces sp. WA6-1-16 TaxID=2879427 RepID=UPI001CE24CB5|nr:hypothetical protein [Streptomyces sp. WA6-1-16]UCA51077.1 hypothetical protein LEL86_18075 [Streptomyces sp. WA6-1-16]